MVHQITNSLTVTTLRLWMLFMVTASLILSGCGHNPASRWNSEGVKLFGSGQFTKAIERFQYALGTDQKNADAYYNLAATYHQMGLNSNDQGFLKESEALYNRCLDFDSDHTDCHRGLAVLLVQTDRKEKAFTLLNNWVQDKPHLSAPRVELARIYGEFGDDQAARVHLEKACAIDKNDARAWKALAALNESEGHKEVALAQYQRSHLLDNQQSQLSTRIASLKQQIRTARANPTTNPGNVNVADEELSRGRY